MESTKPEDDGIGAQLRQAVATYCAEWRNPSLPPFPAHQHTSTSWRGTPESFAAGSYATYADDGTLLYIGKASHRKTMGDRLFVHLQVTKPEWAAAVAHVYLVPVSQPFEAPSLEEYLIRELRPVINAVGRRRD